MGGSGYGRSCHHLVLNLGVTLSASKWASKWPLEAQYRLRIRRGLTR